MSDIKSKNTTEQKPRTVGISIDEINKKRKAIKEAKEGKPTKVKANVKDAKAE